MTLSPYRVRSLRALRKANNLVHIGLSVLASHRLSRTLAVQLTVGYKWLMEDVDSKYKRAEKAIWTCSESKISSAWLRSARSSAT